MINKKLLEILENIAILLEIKGENPFKSRAYSNAAQIIINQYIDIEKAVIENTIGDIKGFGKALETKISEFVTTGRMSYYEKLISEIPLTLIELTKIPGLGARKVKVLYNDLGITTIEELKSACLDNKISKLKGFGEKTETGILAELNKREVK
jgi:DNA polymerase (family X)